MLPAHEKPSLTALRAFDATAHHGSMSEAARHLHVTHGAISRQIRQLEAQLGSELFVRASGKLSLTDAGVALSRTTRESFDAIDQCWQRLRDHERDRPLLFGCTGSLLARWLIPRLESFQRTLPELRLHVVSTDDVLAQSGSQVDVALTYLTPPWPEDRTVIPLRAERFGPVMVPSLNTADTPQALCRTALLTTASRTQAWPLWAEAHAIAPDTLTFRQTFDHLYYLLEAAEAGLGIAIAPDLMVEDAIAQRRLVAPFDFMETEARLCLVSTSHPGPLLKERLERVRAWFTQTLSPASLINTSHNI